MIYDCLFFFMKDSFKEDYSQCPFYHGVCRTAPATRGLSNMPLHDFDDFTQYQSHGNIYKP